MKRLSKTDEQGVISDFADYLGLANADGCKVIYKDDQDTGESWYQVVDAKGHGDGSGEWLPVFNQPTQEASQ